MRKLQLSVSNEEQAALKKARGDRNHRFAERALYVLLNAVKNYSVYEIADLLWRDVRVIRLWLRAYETNGIDGLRSPTGSGGRPREFRDSVLVEMQTLMELNPIDEGFNATHWTKPLLALACEKRMDRTVSLNTIKRALSALGYSYKRTRKTVPSSDQKKTPLKSWSMS